MQKTQRRMGRTLTRRLFSSIRIALTQHGTKSNGTPPPSPPSPQIGGRSREIRLRRRNANLPAGADSGDVVIKDSISQRSVWCDRTLPLTDEVSLTSAL